jgi:acyl-CoA thioesterase-1
MKSKLEHEAPLTAALSGGSHTGRPSAALAQRELRSAALALTLFCVTVAVASGCARSDPDPAQHSPSASSSAPNAWGAETPRVVFLGDSLTAGLGVAPGDSYPALIQRRLREAGRPHEVVNAGVSGDTSAGGLRRLDWSLKGRVDVLVVALGANDALRGLAPVDLERNLGTIVERARARRIAVLLAGMEAPPNFGTDYTRQFRAVYPALAKRYHVPLVPFLLAGVAGVPGLNQADGIHPNPEGHRIIADLIWRQLEPMLTSRLTQ